MGKIIITKQNNRLLLSLFENNKPGLFETTALPDEEGVLGNIYLARIKDIVPAIKGMFLSVEANKTVYLPFSECQKFLLANRRLNEETGCFETNTDALKQGDEIVVQIVKESVKTKPPGATADLTLTGQYCVCDYFGHGIHYSKKLSQDKKNELDRIIREEAIEGRKRYSFTIRTNAESLSEDLSPLFEEMKGFITLFDNITSGYRHRTCYSCFYQKESEIISRIQNIPLEDYDEIVTDDENTYRCLCSFLNNGSNKQNEKPVRFYQDDMLPLHKLYSIETHLKEALGKQVWLPSGGYLIIEPTEAMVVIDVNSGKTEGKGKKAAGFHLNINLEAAKEVARQLKLRNYSGMIMVDFINMENEADKEMLMQKLDRYLKEDKVRTRLIDMTALGIIEITRKKVSKPLADFFK